MIAVVEPLEVVVRARLGHVGRSQVMIAVMEPLEVTLRALFGHGGRNQTLKKKGLSH